MTSVRESEGTVRWGFCPLGAAYVRREGMERGRVRRDDEAKFDRARDCMVRFVSVGRSISEIEVNF